MGVTRQKKKGKTSTAARVGREKEEREKRQTVKTKNSNYDTLPECDGN